MKLSIAEMLWFCYFTECHSLYPLGTTDKSYILLPQSVSWSRSPPLFLFPHIFPSLPHLMSKNLFDRTDVLSSGYVNIYWHDDQQEGGGELLRITHSVNLQVFSLSVQSMRRFAVGAWLDVFLSLGSCFCCRCHSYSCGRLYQLLRRPSPAHTHSYHSRLAL